MRKLLVILASVCPMAWGNKALDLLDAELPSSGQIYLDSVDPPKPGEAGEKKEKLLPPDPMLPERWALETPSLVTFGERFVTRIAPRGLFEYQYQDQSRGRGSDLSRARIGFAMQTYYGIELKADALFSDRGDYEGWDTLQVRVPISERLAVKAGKFSPEFSTEYTQDPTVRWFPTLSPLVAQISPASSLGIVAEGNCQNLEWKGGWFSNDSDRSIPGLEGNGYLYASLAYSINASGRGGRAPQFHRWHLDYIHNMDREDSEAIPMAYDHLLATGVQFSQGRLDFYSDFLLAKGEGQTVWGMTAAAGYWLLEDAVRLVGRYHYARSKEEGGLLVGWGIPGTGADSGLPFGMPPAVTAARELHSLYGGINLHLFEDNVLLGTGLEYRDLTGVEGEDDFDSWGWNTWVRLAF